MLFYHKARSMTRRFRLLLASFLQRPGLPFADALPEEAIQEAFDQEGVRFGNDEDAVYTPAPIAGHGASCRRRSFGS